MQRTRTAARIVLGLGLLAGCGEGNAGPSSETTSSTTSGADTTTGSAPDDTTSSAPDGSSSGSGVEDCASDALVANTCGCGDATCDAGTWCDAAAGECIAAVCNPGSKWAPGIPAYVEITAGSGLLDAAVEGTRLNVTDIDGDGWPDLFVRRGGVVADVPGTLRTAWLLRNTGGEFEDVTAASGILARRDGDTTRGRPVEVAASADVDNDGDVDIYTGIASAVDGAEGETSELMLNNGDGTYALGPVDSDLRRAGELDVPAGAAFVDANLDGFVDLWVPQNETGGAGVQDRLYYGDGTGMFYDGTRVSGLTTMPWSDYDTLNEGRAHSRAWSAVACDLNGDGWSELLAASYGRSPNHLWQAVPTDEDFPQFSNRGVASAYAFDENQTWEDNQFAACFCSTNPEEPGCDAAVAPQISCTTPNWNHDSDREPYRLGGNSGATVCADIDNDGALDLWTSEIKHWWAGVGADGSDLLRNTGEADVRFERPGREALGLEIPHVTGNSWDEGHMSANVLDFDNDGWPDIYVGASDYPGNRGLLFHQQAPLSFALVPTGEGFEHNRSHGVATADFDRDGDLDLVVGHSRARCDSSAQNDCYPTQQIRIFSNEIGELGNFIQLSLTGGDGSNAMAVGARVTVEGTGGDAVQTQEIGGGFGHFGAQNDRVLHFGLGEACTARVTVRWPDHALTEQTFELPAGHRYAIDRAGSVSRVP